MKYLNFIYSDFDLGLWVDPDLGCFDNDFVGCDSSRSLMFAYNGVRYDADCVPELGFDSLPVALGIQMLSQPMDVFGYFKSCTPCPAQGDLVGSPACAAYRDFLEGFWGDGTPFEIGGDGYNTGRSPIKFCFPGDPTDTSQWSEVQANEVPGDRRMFSSTKTLSFSPGQTLHYDFGFTTSFDSTSNNLSIVDSLKQDADTIRNFYLRRILPAQQVLAIKEIAGNNPFRVSIYPNPSHNQVTIIAEDNIQTMELTDITGRVIVRKTTDAKSTTLSVSNLAKGVYLVNIVSGDNTVIKKIVVE